MNMIISDALSLSAAGGSIVLSKMCVIGTFVFLDRSSSTIATCNQCRLLLEYINKYESTVHQQIHLALADYLGRVGTPLGLYTDL